MLCLPPRLSGVWKVAPLCVQHANILAVTQWGKPWVCMVRGGEDIVGTERMGAEGTFLTSYKLVDEDETQGVLMLLVFLAFVLMAYGVQIVGQDFLSRA